MRHAYAFIAIVLTAHVAAGEAQDAGARRPANAAAQTEAGDTATANAREALQRYADALQSLDAAAVKRVQPSINVETLGKAFRDMRELKVEIDTVRVLSAEPATMRVSCRVTQTLTPKAGSRQTTAVTRVIRLRRDGSVWTIDAFER
jgi:hypothetical protein